MSRMRASAQLIIAATLGASLVMGAGCARTPGAGDAWPVVEALPSAPPADLDLEAPTTLLRAGSDGFLYVVGGVPAEIRPGSGFLARYSGDWPLTDLPRPPLVAGRVLKVLDGAAIVSPTYTFPDADVEGLEVTWGNPPYDEDMGKGMGVVSVPDTETPMPSIRIDLGSDVGVQKGDLYALLDAPAPSATPRDLQLSRRILNICLVDEVADESASCRLWRGSTLHPSRRMPANGDTALFLEHTFGRAPQMAMIELAEFGEGGEIARKHVGDALRAFIASVNSPNAIVDELPKTFDATDQDFYQIEEEVEYSGGPQIVVGGSIVPGPDGKKHLVLNYTGIGPSSGPGMIAAPPEGGVDMGPVDELEARDIVGFASVVWSAVNVYRGQTSEALMHLTLALEDDDLRGPVRWHARDQYAMRFAALGHTREAFWMIQEDMEIARKRNDQQAYLNALGTVVRLYDLLELPQRAVETASEYLAAREPASRDSSYLSALAMHAEMLMGAGEVEPALLELQRLKTVCGEGCSSQMNGLLGSIYWAIPVERQDLQAPLLEDIVRTAREAGGGGGLASARVYQGIVALREDRLEDAMIAFLEAERLYEKEKFDPGSARAKYFIMLTQMARKEPDSAFESGLKAVEIQRKLQDFTEAAHTYERLASLYVNMGKGTKPGRYLGAARDVLTAAVSAQLAMGNYGKASHGLYNLATFYLKIGQLPAARITYQRAVLFAIRSTRFDIAAMCHLSLGIIAREEGNAETFRDEVSRAKIMAEISDDPTILDAIKRALSPPEPQPDVPTQLL